MLTRIGQMTIAVLGMVLILHYGITRDPGWGEISSLHPVIWTIHRGPLVAGIVCLLLTFVTIAFLDRR